MFPSVGTFLVDFKKIKKIIRTFTDRSLPFFFMPFRRYARRRPYRRRRYSRKSRPRVSRAVLGRGMTFAPRHQYLKLKRTFLCEDTASKNGSSPALANTYLFRVPLQLPGQDNAAMWDPVRMTMMQSNIARGWDAYGALFERYCIAGVKLKFHCMPNPYNNIAASGSQHGGAVVWTVPTAMSYDDANRPSNYGAISDAPLARSHGVVSGTKALSFKRYINMNTLFGEVVKKHDKYVHAWDVLYTNANAKLGHCVIFVDQAHSFGSAFRDFAPTVYVEAVYYVHALFTNTAGISPVALEALKAISEPGGALGEPKELAGPDTLVRDSGQLPRDMATLKDRQRLMTSEW